MALIFVTGNSGSGKSTIRKALATRGYETHDTDEDGLTSWVNKETGEKVPRPTDIDQRTNDFYDNHDWRLSRERVEELAKAAEGKTVFLCGSVSNDSELTGLFGKVVFLSVDPETLTQRLTTRTDNDFGKSPDELENILGWHENFERENRDRGAVVIDAARSVDEVVGDIITSVDKNNG